MIMATPAGCKVTIVMNGGSTAAGKLIRKMQHWTGLKAGVASDYKEQVYNLLSAVCPVLKYPVLMITATDTYELTEE